MSKRPWHMSSGSEPVFRSSKRVCKRRKLMQLNPSTTKGNPGYADWFTERSNGRRVVDTPLEWNLWTAGVIAAPERCLGVRVPRRQTSSWRGALMGVWRSASAHPHGRPSAQPPDRGNAARRRPAASTSRQRRAPNSTRRSRPASAAAPNPTRRGGAGDRHRRLQPPTEPPPPSATRRSPEAGQLVVTCGHKCQSAWGYENFATT
jgi:hypothetical protein